MLRGQKLAAKKVCLARVSISEYSSSAAPVAHDKNVHVHIVLNAAQGLANDIYTVYLESVLESCCHICQSPIHKWLDHFEKGGCEVKINMDYFLSDPFLICFASSGVWHLTMTLSMKTTLLK